MSNYNSGTQSTPSNWDPSSLVLDGVKPSQAVARKGRRVSPVRGKFIAGPLDAVWLSQARKLGATALWVGLVLWFLRGLKKSDTFVVSNLILQEWGVQPDTKSRVSIGVGSGPLIGIQKGPL